MDARKMKSVRRRQGFTLVELIMTVLVIAIAAAMVVPRMTDSAATRALAAARMLAADLEYAQVYSITHSDDVCVVVFDTTNHRYDLALASDTATPLTHPTSLQPYRITFGQGQAYALTGVQITAVSVGGDNQLKFGAYGQLDQAANATITVTCDGASAVVTVDAVTGETTIQ